MRRSAPLAQGNNVGRPFAPGLSTVQVLREHNRRFSVAPHSASLDLGFRLGPKRLFHLSPSSLLLSPEMEVAPIIVIIGVEKTADYLGLSASQRAGATM
jgi:hypothetical protein